MKERIIRETRTLFEQEDDYYKTTRVCSFLNHNYIEYESNGDLIKKPISKSVKLHLT